MWLLSFTLIGCGFLSFFMGLSHDGLEAPQPTTAGAIMGWGGVAAIIVGAILLAWNVYVGVCHLAALL